MSTTIEEIDYRHTQLGELVLRRRTEPLQKGIDVYEVKLGDEYLMSSLFTAGEIALAELGLEGLATDEVNVVIGGLGLGYTANAALRQPSIQSVVIIEALGEVIDWHRQGLIPLGRTLTTDPRCRFIHGDFFALALASEYGFDAEAPQRRFNAVLVDIDHSPRHWLHPDHAALYTPAGLRRLKRRLSPGGVFALWSNDPPDDEFSKVLESVFASAKAHIVSFENPYTGGQSSNTIYVASK